MRIDLNKRFPPYALVYNLKTGYRMRQYLTPIRKRRSLFDICVFMYQWTFSDLISKVPFTLSFCISFYKITLKYLNSHDAFSKINHSFLIAHVKMGSTFHGPCPNSLIVYLQRINGYEYENYNILRPYNKTRSLWPKWSGGWQLTLMYSDELSFKKEICSELRYSASIYWSWCGVYIFDRGDL